MFTDETTPNRCHPVNDIPAVGEQLLVALLSLSCRGASPGSRINHLLHRWNFSFNHVTSVNQQQRPSQVLPPFTKRATQSQVK